METEECFEEGGEGREGRWGGRVRESIKFCTNRLEWYSKLANCFMIILCCTFEICLK